jgi:hypothetical protein
MIRNQQGNVRAEHHAAAEATWPDRPHEHESSHPRRDGEDDPNRRVPALLGSNRLRMRERIIVVAVLVMLTCVVETSWHYLFG